MNEIQNWAKLIGFNIDKRKKPNIEDQKHIKKKYISQNKKEKKIYPILKTKSIQNFGQNQILNQ